jgi:hypothetical protein
MAVAAATPAGTGTLTISAVATDVPGRQWLSDACQRLAPPSTHPAADARRATLRARTERLPTREVDVLVLVAPRATPTARSPGNRS